MTTFFHISDLHLGYTRWKSWSKYASHYPDPDELKRRCLDELGERVRMATPDFLFITGDVSECWGRKRDVELVGILDLVDEALQPLRRTCREIGTKVIAITGDHDPPAHVLRDVLPETREIGDIVEFDRLRIGCLGCRPRREGWKEDLAQLASRAEALDVLLMHYDQPRTSRLLHAMQLSYLGIGHRHEPFWESRRDFVVGRPGHLYSYWDGPDGKPWPTGFVEGEISGEDRVEISFRPFRSVPRTLAFTSSEGSIVLRGLLSGEAAPIGFREVEMTSKEHWRGELVDGVATVGLDAIRDTVRATIEARSRDIFVAKLKGGKSHVVKHGHELLADEQVFDRALSYWFPTG